MSDENKGFTVKDRRLFSEEGEPREEALAEQEASAASQPADIPPPRAEEPGPPPTAGPLPPVDFSGLILSLSHAAMTHLGLAPAPQGGESRADQELARHTIDTIAMLKDKTSGNLDLEEQKLIDHVLTDLRMAFVKIFG